MEQAGLPLAKNQISKTFDRVAKTYDLLNRILSCGIDQMWRKKMLEFVPIDKEIKAIDLATGTADVAITLLKNRSNISHIMATDLSTEMMNFGKKKTIKQKLQHRIAFQKEDAQSLSFEQNQFDLATMSFGLRNIPDRSRSIKEMHRVLRSKGRALILEFSLPSSGLIRQFYLLYFRYFLPFIGGLISGDFKAYSYLNKSVEDFPDVESIVNEFRQHQFKVKVIPLTFGIATLYVLDKEGNS